MPTTQRRSRSISNGLWLPAIAAASFLAAACILGCEETAPAPAGSTTTAAQKIEEPAREFAGTGTATTAAPSTALTPPLETDEGELLEESWEAYSIQGYRVGYARTTREKIVEAGQALVRTRNYSQLVMQRDGQPTKQEMDVSSYETPTGQLVRFESRMTTGQGKIEASGRAEGDKLVIEVTTAGKNQQYSIPWQTDWGGFFAADQSIKRQPMKAGEKRTVRGLMPVVNQPGNTVLEAKDLETVKLPGGDRDLLRIDAKVDLGGQLLDMVLWVDDQGETLKSYVPGIQQEAVRTTKEDALGQPAGQFDLLVASIVPLRGELPNPLRTQRVVYRARMKRGSIAGVFDDCLSQRVKLLDDQTAELTVIAVRPDEPAELEKPIPRPTEEDSRPNNLIQSDDPVILKMAVEEVPHSDDLWSTPVGLEQQVHSRLRKKNFSQAFATAAEVAQSLEGDCTEHAVLLAALCRARGYPARVAFGLVFYPPEKGFAYHMWNEVWIADRWVPLDATLGQGGIGCDHIKLADSSLDGVSPYAAMLPVIQVFGNLELEVIEAE